MTRFSQQAIFLATVLSCFTGTSAFAGAVSGPLPLAGVAGPFGLLGAVAVYGGYKAYKHFKGR